MLAKQDSTWKRKPVCGTDNWKQHWPHSHIDVKEWLQVTIWEEAQYTKQLQTEKCVNSDKFKTSVEPDNCL